MAAWTGWESDLLAALSESDSAHNTAWLGEWEKAEHTTCSDNPLSATTDLTGSKRCKELSNGSYARSYTSHAQGVKATVEQLGKAQFVQIRQCLHSADPYSYNDWELVVGELGSWGAHVFAAQYAAAMKGVGQGPGGGAGGPGGTNDASRSLHAYSNFTKVVAHDLPAHLYRSAKLNRETLARLGG